MGEQERAAAEIEPIQIFDIDAERTAGREFAVSVPQHDDLRFTDKRRAQRLERALNKVIRQHRRGPK